MVIAFQFVVPHHSGVMEAHRKDSETLTPQLRTPSKTPLAPSAHPVEAAAKTSHSGNSACLFQPVFELAFDDADRVASKAASNSSVMQLVVAWVFCLALFAAHWLQRVPLLACRYCRRCRWVRNSCLGQLNTAGGRGLADERHSGVMSSMHDEACLSQNEEAKHAEVVNLFQSNDGLRYIPDMQRFVPRKGLVPDAILAKLSCSEQRILRPLIFHVGEDVGWTRHSDRCAEICSRVVPCATGGSKRPIVMWRIRRELRCPSPRTIFDLILDVENQPAWRADVTGGRNLGCRNEAIVILTYFKGIFAAAARESLEYRASCFEPEGASYWIAFTSTGTSALNIPRSHLRDFTSISGCRIRPSSKLGHVDFTLLAHIDRGGSLTDLVTKPDQLKTMNEFCRDLETAIDKRTS